MQTVKPKDRARELAEALRTNPWVDPSIQKVCDHMLAKWDKEDAEAARRIGGPA